VWVRGRGTDPRAGRTAPSADPPPPAPGESYAGWRVTAAASFHHEALFYGSDAEYLAGAVPFIRRGLEDDAAVLVAVGERRRRMLTDGLAADAERVVFVDMPAIGRNPARIIPVWRAFAAEHGARGRPLRGIGEPAWPGRNRDELVECHRHEALLNLAFAETPRFDLLCPYDARGLAPHVLEEARHTHPHVTEAGLSERSPAYRTPAAAFADTLAPPTRRPAVLAFGRDELGAVRDFVAGGARRAGLGADRAEDLVLAVNELATNSLLHASGHGIVRLWLEDGTVLCEVRDDGRIGDPLAGRSLPEPDALGGRGLWLVNQLCDLVQVRTTTGSTVVRVHMARD